MYKIIGPLDAHFFAHVEVGMNWSEKKFMDVDDTETTSQCSQFPFARRVS